jgi:membrane protein YqaA with SNARE-associated domain
MAFIKKHIKFLSFILFFILWSIIIYNISPEEIVNKFGVNNGYLIAFFVAFFASISTLINFPYQLVILSLASGGLNPILLGISAGGGEILGDSTSYFIGYHGHHVLPSKFQQSFKKFTNWCIKGPTWVTSAALFLYGAFVPLPNDLIIVPLALGHYPYRRMIFPLALGNIFFNIAIALLGTYT